MYRFLRDELGARFIQFIPCVEPRQFERVAPGHWPEHQLAASDSARARPGHPLSIVTPWSVDPDDWGDFLAQVFDEWLAHDRATIKINLFETMFAQLAGKPAHLVHEQPRLRQEPWPSENDGRVYSCDHFVYPEYELATLATTSCTPSTSSARSCETPLAELAFSLRQLEFGLAKHNTLPSECKTCPYLKLCWGECPRTRLLKTRPARATLSYLCSGWKHFSGTRCRASAGAERAIRSCCPRARWSGAGRAPELAAKSAPICTNFDRAASRCRSHGSLRGELERYCCSDVIVRPAAPGLVA